MGDGHDCNQKEEFQKLTKKVSEVFDNNATLHLSQQELHLSHKAIDKKVDAVLDSLKMMAEMQRESMLSDNDHKNQIEQIRTMVDEFKKTVEKINDIQFAKHTDTHQKVDALEKFVAVYDELKVKENVATLMTDRTSRSGAKEGIKAYRAEIYVILGIAGMILKWIFENVTFTKGTG